MELLVDKQDIQTILDTLDVQVSMGRIDQATYDTLKQKWLQQLQEIEAKAAHETLNIGTSNSDNVKEEENDDILPVIEKNIVPATPEPSPEEPARYTIEVLSCPKCGAPTTFEAALD